jgi:hypothetical protein
MLTRVTVVLMTFGLMFAVEEEVFVVVVVEEMVVVGLLELDGPAVVVVVLGSSKNDMVSTLDPSARTFLCLVTPGLIGRRTARNNCTKELLTTLLT